MLQKPIYR